MKPVVANHIETNPGVCGGRPCIAGSRIRVQDVFIWHEVHGKSPDEIVADFPQLSLGDVHAALAYYWDNRELIQQQLREEEEFVASIKATTGPGPLERKLAGDQADGDKLSSG